MPPDTPLQPHPRASDRYAWTRRGPHRVAPGVHRIPCPLPDDGLRAVNVYAIEDQSGVALIDAGWRHPETLRALEAGLRVLGIGLADITMVICTHSHYDHYGLATHVRRVSGAPIALGRVEREALAVALDRDLYMRWVARRCVYLEVHGAGALAAWITRQASGEQFDSIRGVGEWGAPDRLLDDGDRIRVGDRVLSALLTPGHTRGHLAFLDEANGLLFAGDHVLPHITPSLGFEPFMDGKSLQRFLDALRAARHIRADVVLPGHGPVFSDLPGRIDELLEHHEKRLAGCLAILADHEGHSAASVAAQLTWTRHERTFDELDKFNQMLAVTETVTHLELLVDRGQLKRAPGPIYRYVVV
jgi:glyoxylase-like metal-dependent hydrolase (beta-lactamase superfamily II)